MLYTLYANEQMSGDFRKKYLQSAMDSHGYKVSSCGQRRLRSDCTNAQADLSRRWAHTRNNPNYWYRYAFANGADPDQTPQNAASDQGLHCLP